MTAWYGGVAAVPITPPPITPALSVARDTVLRAAVNELAEATWLLARWEERALEAERVLAAVRSAAVVTFKGPNDSDADYLRAAAKRLEGDFKPGGSNVTAAVVRTLRAVADLAEVTT